MKTSLHGGNWPDGRRRRGASGLLAGGWTALILSGSLAAAAGAQSAPLRVLSVSASCREQQITVAFNQAVDPKSAEVLTNYSLYCADAPNAITQAVVMPEDRRILQLFAAEPFRSGPTVGSCCFLVIQGVADASGEPMPASTNQACCTGEPCTRTSAGTEYWLAFAGNYTRDVTNAVAPQLFVTGPTGTVGTVIMPGLLWTNPFVIPDSAADVAGNSGVAVVIMPTNADLGDLNDEITTQGVHVLASQPVAVYGLNYLPYTSDAYLGLSTNAIGWTYMVLTYRNVFTNVPALNGAQFALVAAQDNTTVTIVPSGTVGGHPAAVGGHPAGVPYNLPQPLMQGQTYQLRDTDNAPADLTGTLIFANHPISVFAGHQLASIPTNLVFGNYIVEQLPPLDLWGTNFVTVPLATRKNGDTFRILALLDGTSVSIGDGTQSGTPAVFNIDAGRYFQTNFVDLDNTRLIEITASQPVLVAQFSDSADYDKVTNADPFMITVPPISAWASSYTIQAPTNFANNYLNLAAPGNVDISLDGSAVPAPVGGNDQYRTYQVPIASGPHTVVNAGGVGFGLTVYGWGPYNGYGYPGGMCSSPQALTNLFPCPQQTTSVAVQAGPGCMGEVPPDLTTNWVPDSADAASTVWILQDPPAGSPVQAGTQPIPVTLTLVDQLGYRHACPDAVTLTVNCLQISMSGPKNGGNVTITWSGSGTLQTAPAPTGPWTNVPNAVSPYHVLITGKAGYYRIHP